MKTITIELSKLKTNETILTIRPINKVVVSQYRQHLRAGAVFPPIVVTRHFGIVSGHHRHRAYLDEYGEQHKIEVEVRDFRTEADAIEFSVEQNITHGLQFDGISRKRALFTLLDLGRSPERLAQLFGVSVKRVQLLAEDAVIVRGESKPVKRGLGHLRGKRVSVTAYKEHIAKDVAVPARQNAEQLTRWLTNGWVDLNDLATVSALEQLQAAIEAAFNQQTKGAQTAKL